MKNKTPAQPITLTLTGIVRTERRRSMSDRRVFVNWTVAEYRGSDGEVYRKSFEVKAGQPVIPTSGTHGTLGALSKQW